MDLFKTAPEGSREPEMKDREVILAYLEELAKTKTLVTIQVTPKDLVPYTGTVQLVNDARNLFTVTIKRPLTEEPAIKAPLHVVFSLDGARLQANVRYLGRGGYLQLELSLPEKVTFAERRGKLRAKFGPREHASVTALEDLFSGTGTAGKLLNLSMEGLCMKLDRAIQVQADRKLEVSDGLFHRGQKLLMVRIQELPQVPLIECSGEVAWIRSSGAEVEMGLVLWGLGAQESHHLEQVMTRRLPSFTRDFPVRHRRHREGAEPGQAYLPPAEMPEPAQSPTPSDAEEIMEPSPNEGPVSPEEGGTPEERKGRDRLLHWRRQSKHLLVVMADDLDRAIIAGTLQVGGFANIHEAKSLIQAIDRCKKHLPDLLILEGQVGPHTAPEIITKLRAVGVLEMSPIVVLVERSDVKVKLAAKALKLRHLIEKPVDYDGLLKGLLDKLLDLK